MSLFSRAMFGLAALIAVTFMAMSGARSANAQEGPNFADLDIEISKVCVNATEGTFTLNIETSVDLSELDPFILDLLQDEFGVLDDDVFDADGIIGTIDCGETATFVFPELTRALLALELLFPIPLEVVLEEVGVPEGVTTTMTGDCDADGLLLEVDPDLVAAQSILIEDFEDLLAFLDSITTEEPEFVCEITNEFPPSSLTITKSCVPANAAGSFNILVDGNVEGTVTCGGFVTLEDVEPGSYIVAETGAEGTDLANFTTLISCTDGSAVTATTIEVDVLGETTCWIVNVEGELTDEEAAGLLLELEIEIENELNNINQNINDNANNNTNNNVNENTQNQTNDQDTNVTTGDVNVSSGGGSGTGTGTGEGTGAVGSSGAPKISPPNTGSAGLADGGASFGLLAAVIGLVSLAAVRFAVNRS